MLNFTSGSKTDNWSDTITLQTDLHFISAFSHFKLTCTHEEIRGKFSKRWCKNDDTKCGCKCKCECEIVWSCLAHIQYLVHKPKWRLTTNMTNMWTLLHTYILFHTMTWHTCTLAKTLTHSHCASHNYMTSLQTYLHPHSHTHVHFTYTQTFTSHNCTFVNTPTHSHTNIHHCTNLAHLVISPPTSWLSQLLYYNANLKIWLR